MAGRPTPHLKTEQMDSFFDFNMGTNQASPVTASSSRADALSPFEHEERQQFNGPSHDYGQFKQQVGLPVGSMANMPQYDGFNSGMGEADFNSGFGWNSGIDLDADMSMDFNGSAPMPPMFFPTSNDTSSNNFVNPNNVGGHEEPTSNVGRLWPGMHSQQAQQAAMQKAAQAQAVQQRQMKLQAQHAQYRQAASAAQTSSQSQASAQHSHGKRPAHAEAHVEESISRLLNQMRQNSSAPSDDAGSPSNALPNIARMKKDEEEMDEDERLLASEEGKKLSSKERRQLRNKVSARAFRSRRKEYIGQLEGELALKNQEATTLRNENQSILAENERYRGLIETLLRHPAFSPFINDISRDPQQLFQQAPQQQQRQSQPQQQQQPEVAPPQQQAQPQVQQQDMKPEYPDFDASQLQIPMAPQEQQHTVNLVSIPEEPFNKLNLYGNQSMNFNNYSVNAYALTELPTGPNPVNLLADSSAYLPYASSTAAASSSTTNDSGLDLLFAKLDRAARNLDGSQ